MAKKLNITLPPGWVNVSSENADRSASLCWADQAATGVVQVSLVEHTGGNELRPGENDLIEMAVSFGERQEWGENVSSSSGDCTLGIYGTASFKRSSSMSLDAAAYCQVWCLTNGLDFAYVTLIAMVAPSERELKDAWRIADALTLA